MSIKCSYCDNDATHFAKVKLCSEHSKKMKEMKKAISRVRRGLK